MEIKWTNIICLALVIFAIILMVKTPHQIGAFLSTMKDIGPEHSHEEKTVGLLAFGLLMVIIVALAKIVIESNRRN